jgi:hypothetical protein
VKRLRTLLLHLSFAPVLSSGLLLVGCDPYPRYLDIQNQTANPIALEMKSQGVSRILKADPYSESRYELWHRGRDKRTLYTVLLAGDTVMELSGENRESRVYLSGDILFHDGGFSHWSPHDRRIRLFVSDEGLCLFLWAEEIVERSPEEVWTQGPESDEPAR